MTKLQEIENKLLSVNEAAFQNVCDAFLYFTEREYPDICRPGSQKGKQKTTKGTPDTFFILKNGRYVLVEYTTKSKTENKQAFLNKVQEDIDKCLNEVKTGISLSGIEKLIYCCNATLNTNESKELLDYCLERGVRLELKTIDTLALGLLGRCTNVAKEFLGISIDTGQILTPTIFTQEYESSGFATPLSNTFLKRDNELEQLTTAIRSGYISIVTGPPGVGKSKLVLAAFEKIAKEDDNYITYIISNKNASIHDDLRVYLGEGKNYLLLIDDANRQTENFKSILGILKERRKSKIHVVVTVRDYAYHIVKERCAEFHTVDINVSKFSDEELKDILASKDFEISNSVYQRRILEIADGNPRLAIMAAKIAIEKQNLQALHDVSTLYDKYFELAIPEESFFKNKELLKTLGLVSFFFSVNLRDENFCKRLFDTFKIDEYVFREALDKLERLELLELSADLMAVRVSEQVLSTYFFYKTFLKDGLLDFKLILNNYFDSHLPRIVDTIIPANNTFGYENVYQKIDPHLDDFWAWVSCDELKALKFLNLFWFYKQDNALSFIDDKISNLPLADNPVFEFDEEKLQRSYQNEKDKYLELLSKFFYHSLPNLINAIEITFEYCKRKPEVYAEVIKTLKEVFIFSYEDEQSGFYRQQQLLDYITAEINKEERVCIKAFFDIAPTLMKTSYHVTSGGRKKNTISFYTYKLPLNIIVKKIRKKVWQVAILLFKTFPIESKGLLVTYLERTPDKVKAIFEFDLPFLVRIFKKHLKSKRFEDCYIVQDACYWFRRVGIKNVELEALKLQFVNDDYMGYSLLSRDRLRDKFEHHHKLDLQEYDRLKELEIRKSFQFKTQEEFNHFYKTYSALNEWHRKRKFSLNHSLDIVLDENLKHNPDHGIQFLKRIISKENVINFLPWLTFQSLIAKASEKELHRFYKFILKREFWGKDDWIITYLKLLPENLITSKHVDDLICLLKNLKTNFYVDISYLTKFFGLDPFIILKVVIIVVEKNEEGKVKLQLDHQFFENNTKPLKDYLDILKLVYFQQEQIAPHFDHDFKDFLEILRLDNNFLREYLEHLSKDQYSLNSREYSGLSVIWELENAVAILENAFDFLSSKGMYYVKEDFCNAFFEGLNEVDQKRAIQFLNHYLTKNKLDMDKVNTVFDCIRHSFRDKLNEFIKSFLSINTKLEDFKEIDWTDRYFFGNGDTIIGDVKAAQLQTVLETINTIQRGGYKFSKHKEYLKSMINDEKRYADSERKRKFMNADW